MVAGEKIREDETGVTVEGVPLEVYVAEEEEKTKGDEIQQERGKDEAEKRKVKRQGLKAKYDKRPVNQRVVKRVRRWTDREIREEYGLMEKPFKHKMENILWMIVNEGPVIPTEIAAKLGIAPGDVSGALSRLMKRLGKDLIERDETVQPFVYKARHSFSPEAGYRTFLERDDTGKKKPRTKRKQALRAAAQPRKKGHTKSKLEKEAEKAAAAALAVGAVAEVESRVDAFVQSMNGLGIEVKVTGKIQILFGWVGRVDVEPRAVV